MAGVRRVQGGFRGSGRETQQGQGCSCCMPLSGTGSILPSHMHSLAAHLCRLHFLHDSHIQNNGVPLTVDEPKYTNADVQAKVLAILTPTGYVDSVSADGEGPVGLVLDTTSFYAEQGEASGRGRGAGSRVGRRGRGQEGRRGQDMRVVSWCWTPYPSSLSRVRRGRGVRDRGVGRRAGVGARRKGKGSSMQGGGVQARAL